jgi:hypothetical protein
MKRFWSQERMRTITRIRTRGVMNDVARPHVNRHELVRRARQRSRSSVSKGETTVTAPKNFSLIENSDEMLDFFNRIQSTMQQQFTPFLDLSGLQSLTPDSIIALASNLEDWVERFGIGISGNEPIAQPLADVLGRSGFYDHVDVDRVKTVPDRGMIQRKKDRRVDSPVASRLVEFAAASVGCSPAMSPIYGTLIECMGNTFDHAHKSRRGREYWWASVYFDEPTRTAHFTFLDNGVGIFRSRQLRRIEKLRHIVGLPEQPRILQEIFEGKLASRTGVPYRGRGLPRIYKNVQRGRLTNVIVISNRVRADLAKSEFTSLKNNFSGTLFHWELS